VPIILISGLGSWIDIIYINADEGTLDGALTDSIGGYVDMAVLTMLILSASHIMRVGGAFDKIKEIAFSFIKESARRTELVICGFVATLNVFIIVNTTAEIAAAPIVSDISKKLKIHPYRGPTFSTPLLPHWVTFSPGAAASSSVSSRSPT